MPHPASSRWSPSQHLGIRQAECVQAYCKGSRHEREVPLLLQWEAELSLVGVPLSEGQRQMLRDPENEMAHTAATITTSFHNQHASCSQPEHGTWKYFCSASPLTSQKSFFTPLLNFIENSSTGTLVQARKWHGYTMGPVLQRTRAVCPPPHPRTWPHTTQVLRRSFRMPVSRTALAPRT